MMMKKTRNLNEIFWLLLVLVLVYYLIVLFLVNTFSLRSDPFTFHGLYFFMVSSIL